MDRFFRDQIGTKTSDWVGGGEQMAKAFSRCRFECRQLGYRVDALHFGATFFPGCARFRDVYVFVQ